MKSSPTQSATSLPRAPRDDAHNRMTKYFTMMTIRVACFVLMVVIQPYSWYTWLFAIGAIFLPYVAVVIANVAAPSAERAVPPERALEAPDASVASPAATSASERPASRVIRLQESPTPGSTRAAGSAAGAAEEAR